jgi:hypothetical protein
MDLSNVEVSKLDPTTSDDVKSVTGSSVEQKPKSLIVSFRWGNDDGDSHLVTAAIKNGKVTILVQEREGLKFNPEAQCAVLIGTFEVLAGSYEICGWWAGELVQACAGVLSLDPAAHVPVLPSALRAFDAGLLDIALHDRRAKRYFPVLLAPARRLVWDYGDTLSTQAAAEARWGSDVIREGERYAAYVDGMENDGPSRSFFSVIDGVLTEIAIPEQHYQQNLLDWELRQAKKAAVAPELPLQDAQPVTVAPLRNLMEMVADPHECAFDQACRFGNRVGGHAVYCHNEQWEDAPRKCRRTRYTGGVERDEDCPGFEPNPNRSSD